MSVPCGPEEAVLTEEGWWHSRHECPHGDMPGLPPTSTHPRVPTQPCAPRCSHGRLLWACQPPNDPCPIPPPVPQPREQFGYGALWAASSMRAVALHPVQLAPAAPRGIWYGVWCGYRVHISSIRYMACTEGSHQTCTVGSTELPSINCSLHMVHFLAGESLRTSTSFVFF